MTWFVPLAPGRSPSLRFYPVPVEYVMLCKFRRKEPAHASTLGMLLRCNAPPLDEERLVLHEGLQNLKAEYEGNCGMGYAPAGPIPKVGRRLHEDIQRHLRALSPIRSIPLEIWHAIFERVVLSTDPRAPHQFVLGDIRLVSRGWDAAACSCPTLWCNLPLIDASIPQKHLPQTGEDVGWNLRHYLSRSGNLPISFTYHSCQSLAIQATEGGPQCTVAVVYLHVLAKESHRWGVAAFRAPKAILDALLDMSRCLRLPTPLLSKFSFEMHATEPVPAHSTITVDLFHDAPNLRHVLFDVLGQWGTANRYYINTNVDLHLPWGQLETFEGVFERDTAYSQVLTNAVKLKVLRYTSNSPDPIPLTAASSRTLSELRLHFGNAVPRDALFAHLGRLTLPALKVLEVYWWNRSLAPYDDVYGAILSLVRRSGCSLERLATEPTLNYNRRDRFQLLKHLFFQCSTLTHLDIAYLGPHGLRHLVIAPTNPPLSNLRVLTVRSHQRRDLFQCDFPDPVALLSVTHSRRSPSNGLRSQLEDVYIKLSNAADWRTMVMRLGDGLRKMKELQVPFDLKVLEIALRWKSQLLTYFPDPPRPAPSRSDKRIQRLLAEMESFDPWGKDTRVLTWMGVPAILNAIGEAGPLAAQELTINAHIQRARSLLMKWKAHLLLDFRLSPYRWCYIDENTSRIKCVGTVGLEPNGGASEGEIDWERIIGKGDIDDCAAASKGSAGIWMHPLFSNP